MTTKANLEANTPAGTSLTEAEKKAARHEGAKEAEKESGKDTYRQSTDGIELGENSGRRFVGSDEIMQYEGLLTLGVAEFEEMAARKDETAVPEEKLYGLLALERNGQNRTPYVKAMMKRLKLKGDELPGGGPAYTNDVTNITDL